MIIIQKDVQCPKTSFGKTERSKISLSSVIKSGDFSIVLRLAIIMEIFLLAKVKILTIFTSAIKLGKTLITCFSNKIDQF